jgi:hypothetical protein
MTRIVQVLPAESSFVTADCGHSLAAQEGSSLAKPMDAFSFILIRFVFSIVAGAAMLLWAALGCS